MNISRPIKVLDDDSYTQYLKQQQQNNSRKNNIDNNDDNNDNNVDDVVDDEVLVDNREGLTLDYCLRYT